MLSVGEINYHYNHFPALWTFSRTTRVSWYQKKHSPTLTYHGHQSSLNCFLHCWNKDAYSNDLTIRSLLQSWLLHYFRVCLISTVWHCWLDQKGEFMSTRLMESTLVEVSSSGSWFVEAFVHCWRPNILHCWCSAVEQSAKRLSSMSEPAAIP